MTGPDPAEIALINAFNRLNVLTAQRGGGYVTGQSAGQPAAHAAGHVPVG